MRPEKPAITLSSLPRRRLGDQIADVLCQQILLADLNPGRNIPKRETLAAPGGSRTLLREALLILEADGLVEMAPAKKSIVARPSLIGVTHLLPVQSTLEALAGECACDEITGDQTDEIEAMHQTMLATSEESDPIEFFQIDMSFHVAIVAATNNLPLIKTHRQHHVRLWRARFLSSCHRIARPKAMFDHGRIVDGLRIRDKKQVPGSMTAHLHRVVGNVKIVCMREADEETEDARV